MIKIANAGMIAADDEMTAAEIFTTQGRKNCLARSGIAGES